jgi:predicted ABC-type sugar transport system permease subunit
LIREFLASAYKRTLGVLKNWLAGSLSSATRGGGFLQLLYIVVVVALMAGFINAVFFPTTYQGIVYPSGGAQTIPEAFIDAFVILTGGVGIYLTYISGKQTTRPRAVNLYLGLALLLIAVSLLAGVEIAVLKGFG